jgi:hypothetical protein
MYYAQHVHAGNERSAQARTRAHGQQTVAGRLRFDSTGRVSMLCSRFACRIAARTRASELRAFMRASCWPTNGGCDRMHCGCCSWRAWIPVECSPGHYSESLSSCVPCPAGRWISISSVGKSGDILLYLFLTKMYRRSCLSPERRDGGKGETALRTNGCS